MSFYCWEQRSFLDDPCEHDRCGHHGGGRTWKFWCCEEGRYLPEPCGHDRCGYGEEEGMETAPEYELPSLKALGRVLMAGYLAVGVGCTLVTIWWWSALAAKIGLTAYLVALARVVAAVQR